MAGSPAPRGTMITGINVTPLVDVVLVLLVILMVTSAYISSQTIPVDLPAGKTGEAQVTTLAVSIDAAGALYLDGHALDHDALRSAAAAAQGEDEGTRAVIAADGEVSHRHVVRVIDVLREVGVYRYAIQVQPEDP